MEFDEVYKGIKKKEENKWGDVMDRIRLCGFVVLSHVRDFFHLFDESGFIGKGWCSCLPINKKNSVK